MKRKDAYDRQTLMEWLENDMIDVEEEAFMQGYLAS